MNGPMGKRDTLPVAPLTAYGFEVGCSCFSSVQHEMATNFVFAFASTLQRGTFTLRTPLTSCLLGPSAFRNFATRKMPNPQVFFDISINNQNAGRIVMEVTSWQLALYSFSVSFVSLGYFFVKNSRPAPASPSTIPSPRSCCRASLLLAWSMVYQHGRQSNTWYL